MITILRRQGRPPLQGNPPLQGYPPLRRYPPLQKYPPLQRHPPLHHVEYEIIAMTSQSKKKPCGQRFKHIGAPLHYRSHFGSRYHTRADAGTQAFWLPLSCSIPRIAREWHNYSSHSFRFFCICINFYFAFLH